MIKKKKRINAVVESVVPFSDEQQTRLHQKLKKVLQSDNVSIQFALNPNLLGGMTISVNKKLIDLSLNGFLQQFKNDMERQKITSLDISKLAGLFQYKIDEFKPKSLVTEVGEVLSVSDGIAKVSGLDSLMSGECVLFSSIVECVGIKPSRFEKLIYGGTRVIYRLSDVKSRTAILRAQDLGLVVRNSVLYYTFKPFKNSDKLKPIGISELSRCISRNSECREHLICRMGKRNYRCIYIPLVRMWNTYRSILRVPSRACGVIRERAVKLLIFGKLISGCAYCRCGKG